MRLLAEGVSAGLLIESRACGLARFLPTTLPTFRLFAAQPTSHLTFPPAIFSPITPRSIIFRVKRLAISPGALYTLLNAEFKRRRIVDCNCQMPLAFHIDRPDDVSANWRVGTPLPCPHGCDTLIAEVAAH